MRAFHILMKEKREGEPIRIDFQAETPDYALVIAQSHAGGRDMELWEGQTMVGSLSSSAPQLWRLS